MTTDKKKTFDDVPNRVIFSEVGDQFMAALGTVYDTVPNEIPVILKGFAIDPESGELSTADGIFDSGELRPMITKLTKKTAAGNDKDGKPIFQNVCRAVVVAPVPSIDSLLAHPEGRAYIEGKLATEFSQITMRALREADDLSDESLIARMPKNLDDFINAKRSAGASQNEAFNEYWKVVLEALKNHPGVGQLVTDANLKKAMFEKVLKNRAHALALYGTLENNNVFEGALKLMIQSAQASGMDTQILENWAETRNDQVYEIEAFDMDSLSLDDLDLGDAESEVSSEITPPEAPTAG